MVANIFEDFEPPTKRFLAMLKVLTLYLSKKSFAISKIEFFTFRWM